MPEGRLPLPPQEFPESSPPVPAAVNHEKAQDPLSCSPTAYLMMKLPVLDIPPLLLLRVGQGPSEASLIKTGPRNDCGLSSQELEGILIC